MTLLFQIKYEGLAEGIFKRNFLYENGRNRTVGKIRVRNAYIIVVAFVDNGDTVYVMQGNLFGISYGNLNFYSRIVRYMQRQGASRLNIQRKIAIEWYTDVTVTDEQGEMFWMDFRRIIADSGIRLIDFFVQTLYLMADFAWCICNKIIIY